MADEILPMMHIAGGAPLIEVYDYQRCCFLRALQLEKPEFWKELKVLQLAGDPAGIVRWMTRSGITDAWFKEVVWDTVEFWRKGGLSAGDRNFGPDVIDPAKDWFHYRKLAEQQFQMPWFHPIFTHPAFGDGEGKPESVESFEQRIRKEFETQLRVYTKYLRSFLGEDRTELLRHSQYTALSFSGVSNTAIARQFKLFATKCADHDVLVAVAVKRLADRIGLTIPGKLKRPKRS